MTAITKRLEMMMKLMQVFRLSAIIMAGVVLSGCGINNIPTLDEQVKSSWAQVENQYQRRADLVPNLVATVKGFAAQEKDTLTAVVEARAKVGTMQVDANMLNNPQAMQNFEKLKAP